MCIKMSENSNKWMHNIVPTKCCSHLFIIIFRKGKIIAKVIYDSAKIYILKQNNNNESW